MNHLDSLEYDLPLLDALEALKVGDQILYVADRGYGLSRGIVTRVSPTLLFAAKNPTSGERAFRLVPSKFKLKFSAVGQYGSDSLIYPAGWKRAEVRYEKSELDRALRNVRYKVREEIVRIYERLDLESCAEILASIEASRIRVAKKESLDSPGSDPTEENER